MSSTLQGNSVVASTMALCLLNVFSVAWDKICQSINFYAPFSTCLYVRLTSSNLHVCRKHCFFAESCSEKLHTYNEVPFICFFCKIKVMHFEKIFNYQFCVNLRYVNYWRKMPQLEVFQIASRDDQLVSRSQVVQLHVCFRMTLVSDVVHVRSLGKQGKH